MTLKELIRAAHQGIPEAQYVVGLCYENGLGVDTDKAAAENWFIQSARSDFAAGQYELSLLLQDKGDKYLAEGVDWLRKSAEQGFPLAQYLYSLYCEDGIGRPADPAEAFRLCLLAAKSSYLPAARRAASMLERGVGVDVNLKEAFYWYSRAAELGDGDSATHVGHMYAAGSGVEKNEKKALDCFWEGQKLGSPFAFFALSSVYRFGELEQRVDSEKADALGEWAGKLMTERLTNMSSRK